MKISSFLYIATVLMVAFLCSCGSPTEEISAEELRVQDSVRQAYVADSIARVAAREAYERSIPGAQDSLRNKIVDLLSSISSTRTKGLEAFFSAPARSQEEALAEEQAFSVKNDIIIDAHLLWMLRSFPHSQKPDSIVFRPNSSELHSYRQVFDNGVIFKMFDYESGGGFHCFIPSKNKALLKSFYERLFQDEMNEWVNDSLYAPEDGEAGCYVNIFTRPRGTLVTNYCGC